MTSVFHPLCSSVKPPRRMTNPFFYTPHPLCQLAMSETVDRLHLLEATVEGLAAELQQGKMIGVLVAEDDNGTLGYLSAFSGQIADHDTLPGFVPPVFSYLEPLGYFKTEEARISAINKEIADIEQSKEFDQLKQTLTTTVDKCQNLIANYKQAMAQAKLLRDEKRQRLTSNIHLENGNLTAADIDATDSELIRESQYMKAELRRLKARCNAEIAEKQMALDKMQQHILMLKKERQQRSDALQRWLFSQFVMLNQYGETKNLLDIFQTTAIGFPPSGSGECCEPRLLQYAFSHGLKPRCMAMMWIGESPRRLIRQHLHYYPACQGRCKPILEWMMQGIDTDADHINIYGGSSELKMLYADADILVVGKPEGMLSVPGKSNRESVMSIVKDKYPDAEGPLMVHRLDMATSGIMVVALNMPAYHNLQQQFATHTIRKRYVALLAHQPKGIHPGQTGTISLPLSPDYMHRPCQRVDTVHGKEAITKWQMEENGRIILYPLTGRTHQLRLHCAHPDGLNVPIKGDTLYGTPADRLYLHAEAIDFLHPATQKPMHFEWKCF